MAERVEEETVELEIVPVSTAIAAQDKAQLDIQIATAKSYPRSVRQFKTAALELATLDQETAESMFYTLPRGDKNIQGPSVRFAEIIQYAWGNCRAESKVISIDDTHITAQGTCVDLERNIAARVEVKRKITNKYGKRYNEDMITVTGNAACSIAFRNAIFKVIPFSLAKDIYEKAIKTAVGSEKTLGTRRAEEIARWKSVGVSEKQLLTLLEKKGVEDITIDDLITLTGLRNAIKEGDTTIEQVFSNEKESAATADLNKKVKATKPRETKEKGYVIQSEKSPYFGIPVSSLTLDQLEEIYADDKAQKLLTKEDFEAVLLAMSNQTED